MSLVHSEYLKIFNIETFLLQEYCGRDKYITEKAIAIYLKKGDEINIEKNKG